MKITKITIRVQEIKDRVKFEIANMGKAMPYTVLLKLETNTDHVGYGEGRPSPRVTGESIESITAFLESVKDDLIGRSPYEFERVHKLMDKNSRGNSAAKAAVDIAMHDLCAKGAKLPLYRYLGGDSPVVISDMSVGIDEPAKMADLAKKYVNEGFDILKIKVGRNSKDDVEAIRLIRQAVGENVELRIDANQGWSLKEALRTLEAMEEYNVEEVEQPVQMHLIDDLRYLKQHAKQVVMADESVLSPIDAMRLVKTEAVDMINIKLMKSAGIYPALRINAIAEAAGLNCMVGCMNESRIGISAGAALAASQDNITYADLDGHLILEEVEGLQSTFMQQGGKIILSEEPGLGIRFNGF